MPRNATIKLRDWQGHKPTARKNARNLKVVRGATIEDSKPDFSFRVPKRIYPVLCVAFLFLVAAGICGWLAKNYAASFTVQHVTIQGEFHNQQAHEIETALTPYMQGDFFTVDLQGARTAVVALPWVRYAGLRRQWPNQVIVALEEQTAVTRWGEDKLLNTVGEIFYHDYIGDTSALPVLDGPLNRATDVLSQFEQLQAILEKSGITVMGLKLSMRDTWQLQTSDGISIELGSEHIETRLQRLVSVWSRALQARRGQIATIDLRYSNGFSVSWRTENLNPIIAEKKRDV